MVTWMNMCLKVTIMDDRDSLRLFTSQGYLRADVAIRIQLSPTNFKKAIERYTAINGYLDRPASLGLARQGAKR